MSSLKPYSIMPVGQWLWFGFLCAFIWSHRTVAVISYDNNPTCAECIWGTYETRAWCYYWVMYHECWWTGDWRNPGISSHVIDILQWRHIGRDSVSNHQPHDCLLNRLFRRRSKKTSKLRVTGLCAGNSPVTGEFPAQRDSNAEIVSIWWRHHVFLPQNSDLSTSNITDCLVTLNASEQHAF